MKSIIILSRFTQHIMDTAIGLKVSLANRVTFGNTISCESPKFLCTKYLVGESEDAFYTQAYDCNFKCISFRKWSTPSTAEELEYSKNFDFDESPCEKYFLRVPTWDYFANYLTKSELLNRHIKLYKVLSSQMVSDVMPHIFIPLLNLIRLDYHNYKEITV